MAVLAGARESVLLHLRGPNDVDAADEKGRSPLILAASKGRLEICRLLLDAGADPTLKDNDGNDAIATAISRGQRELADFLKRNVTSALPSSQDQVVRGEIHEELQPPPSSKTLSLEFSSSFVQSEAQALLSAAPSPAGQGSLDAKAPDLPYDLSEWQAESDERIPDNDPSCASEASLLQSAISSHSVIDHDESWEEVEIELPELDDLVRKYIPLNAKQDQSLRALFVEALRDGRVRPDRIGEVIFEIFEEGGRNEVERFENNINMVLEDIGVFVEDDPFSSGDVIGGYADENLENAATEALAFLGRLLSDDADPLALYAREIPPELLTRTDEQELGVAIEAGVKEALTALASSPMLRARIIADLEAANRGATPAQTIFDLSFADRGPAGEEPTSVVADNEDTVDGKGDAGPDDTVLPPDIARHVSCILDRCSRTYGPTDQLAGEIAEHLFLARLSDTYLKKLEALAEQDPTAQSLIGLVTRGLDKARMARRRLVETNLKLVIWVAKRYGGLPLMDRIQEGNIGLMRAAERFDFKRGVKFSSYAVWWIRQGILRANADTSRMIRLPVHVFDSLRKVERARLRFHNEMGYEPEADQIAGPLEMSPLLVKRLLHLPEEPFPNDSEAAAEIGSIIDQETPSPEQGLLISDAQEIIRELLECLDPREERIIRQRFGFGCEEQTLEEIGQANNLTRERIRQIEARALRKLSHPSRIKRLRGLMR
ncbi:RNA polymerase sigma factor RpoD [Rhodomicrobium udaipurense JA643]|uniref:Sigma-70 family RNA polymerase sigma factor n=1 Tax=Rhodomicrobium udaipurense TaxID=1202716 RepID=A0A8I1KIX6_9HYPH|nr:sigma-70 family RNA polymerase sigma factor [Rhodomicrobium udaipurense]KAI94733.1 RNA polymerase sigma factor RpoD [Rhodomicrobium udaipurense JA643]MBJ7542231.1 sigma-70 family RNA polymerase sigma factor [Rhodomicrobium udaipurense]